MANIEWVWHAMTPPDFPPWMPHLAASPMQMPLALPSYLAELALHRPHAAGSLANDPGSPGLEVSSVGQEVLGLLDDGATLVVVHVIWWYRCVLEE